jgi:hypothetical protein
VKVLKVEGQGGGRYIQSLGDHTRRQAVGTALDQQAIERQARIMRESTERRDRM